MSQKIKSSKKLKLTSAWLYFCSGLVAFCSLLIVGELIDTKLGYELGTKFLLLALAAYIFIGVALGRTVLNELIQWHPLYNTLNNVAAEKVKQIIFWPFLYPKLLISIAIQEYL